MEDLEILTQLYKGNHLELEEINKCKKIVYKLMIELKNRVD